MSSIGSPSPFFLAGKKAYQVERSLRFNSNDSAKLNRTFGTNSSNTTKTLSFWIKRGNVGSYQTLFGTTTAGFIESRLQFTNLDQLQFVDRDASDGLGDAEKLTTRKFRDIGAWYHIVFTLNSTDGTADNRIKIYVNGIQETSFSASNNPSSNYSFQFFRSSVDNFIGANNTSDFFDGYMAEINFIDGQAYDPSYFGETDATTGQWNPKKYVGSYGTNGFYLNFSDNSGTTAITLGKDSSGNGNNFTPYNFSVAANLLNDSMPDTPTNNFCNLNALNATNSFNFGSFDGGLVFDQSSNDQAITGTFFVTSGKWYWEIYKNNGQNPEIGICPQFTFSAQSNGSGLTTGVAFITNGGNLRNGNNGTASITGGSAQTGAGWIRIACDMDNKKIWFSDTSGNYFNSGNPATGANAAFDFSSVEVANGWTPYIFMGTGSGHNCYVNFGQFELNSFSSNIPAGFKTLSSANLPDPTILLPNKHFDTLLWSGNATTSDRSITGLNFQPDWAWTKTRNQGYHHALFDSVRGASNILNSDQTFAENHTNGGKLASFDAPTSGNNDGGITWDYGTGNNDTRLWWNVSGYNYVAWNWNAGDTDGKTYTVKVHDFSGNNRYIFDDFQTQAVTLDLAEGGTYIFNMDDASNASHPFSIGTAANGTVYTSGITYFLDGVSKTYSEYTSGFAAASTRRLHITVPASAPVLYYWCSVHSGMGGQINTNSTLGSSNFDGSIQSTAKVNATAGFSIVTYTGNGSSGATIGHGIGVVPDVLILKRRDGSNSWQVFHQALGSGKFMDISSSYQAETSSNRWNDTSPTSTVFTVGNNSNVNSNGGTEVAYCFSEVAGYSKFGSYEANNSSDGPFVYLGFEPKWIMMKPIDDSGNWQIYDNKRTPINKDDGNALYADLSSAETSGFTMFDFLSNGFKLRNTGGGGINYTNTYIYLAFAEAPFKNARAR